MRIFATCKEAIGEIERDIHEMGIIVHPHTMQNKEVKDNPDYDTKEVQAYSFAILNTSDKDDIVGDDLEWCHAEFGERWARIAQNPGDAWKLRKDVWEEFLNSEGKFDYTYSGRMHWQFFDNIKELKENPDSRQVIIQIHDRTQDMSRMRKKRIPCSMYYQFLIREGKLDIIYNMRSCDFYTHFKNDIWLAAELRNKVAKQVGVTPGKFYMFIGSLHMYRGYGTGGKHVF